MTVYDVVPFSNELDLLELRLGILDPWVDFFVLSEATMTFSGAPKPLHFTLNQELFSRYSHKIIVNVVKDDVEGTPFDRDRFQKDAIKTVLDERCAETDLVIFSDVDEIPNPKFLEYAYECAAEGRMVHFAQNLYFYYLNLMETSGRLPSITGEYPGVKKKKWLGSRVCTYEYLKPLSMTDLRDPVHKDGGTRIGEGGWHFSYCGGEPEADPQERVRRKISDFAHQELVTDRNMKRLPTRVAKGKDPFGRRGSKFVKVEIDGSYPEFLLANRARFEHMILP